MALVDTNIILRWLLNDHGTLSPKAEKMVQVSPAASLLVTDIIVAEIVYVLRATGRDREQTGEALLLISRTTAFKYENDELTMDIIRLLTSIKLDFADCYLLARARRETLDIITFDGPLHKAFLTSQI